MQKIFTYRLTDRLRQTTDLQYIYRLAHRLTKLQEHLNSMGVPQYPQYASDVPWPSFNSASMSSSGLKQLAGNVTRLGAGARENDFVFNYD